MIDSTLLRLTAVENDIKEIKQGLGQAFLQLGAVNRMLRDNFNYVLVKSIIENDGDRDAVIAEMKLFNSGASDADFERMVIPAIDANLKIHKEEQERVERELEEQVEEE